MEIFDNDWLDGDAGILVAALAVDVNF